MAASYLRGRVDADRFVDGELLTVIDGVLAMWSAADPASYRTTELLFGEQFMVYDSIAEWCWAKARRMDMLAMSAAKDCWVNNTRPPMKFRYFEQMLLRNQI